MRAGGRIYEGSITFDNDMFRAFIDPVYCGPRFQRIYLPNAGIVLEGHFQMTHNGLILDIDEIGDVLNTKGFRGEAPATWRLYLQRKATACDLEYFIMTHSPKVWTPQ